MKRFQTPEDVLRATDEEILTEAKEEGINIEAEAQEVRRVLLDAIRMSGPRRRY